MKRKKSDILFLDSGAYSAFSKGEEIDIYEYIDFIKTHGPFDVIACLDVIGSKEEGPTRETAEASLKNQRIMEEARVDSIPVFHRGEPEEEYLTHLVDNYEYIGLGTGRALGNRNQLEKWLDRIFKEIICDDKGRPKVKVHGFAVTSFPLIMRYPWYSVDSSSTVIGSAFGKIYLPRVNAEGEFDFTDMRLVSVSDQAKHTKGIGSYITEPTINKQHYEVLFEKLGFEMGEIGGKKRRVTRKEKKANKKTRKPLFDITTESDDEEPPTLANSWEERLRWNLETWKQMQKDLPTFELATGEKCKTKVYSVCSSTGHIGTFQKVGKPRMLVSYVYLHGKEAFLEQVKNYRG